jgi:hypothetical protein
MRRSDVRRLTEHARPTLTSSAPAAGRRRRLISRVVGVLCDVLLVALGTFAILFGVLLLEIGDSPLDVALAVAGLIVGPACLLLAVKA